MNKLGPIDFRKELYSKYFSTFKKFSNDKSKHNINLYYNEFRILYLNEIKDLSKDAAIIDIGCGTGIMLQFLQNQGFQNLYGIDISEQQTEIAKKRGMIVDTIDVFSFFKINSKKFDVIFAMDIIEHLYKEELFEFFTGLKNLLNDNGILIIHTPNGDGLFPNYIIYGDLTHLTIFNAKSLGQILRLTGFTSIRCRETGPTIKSFLSLIRLVLWKIIKLFYYSIRIIETGATEKIITQDFICFAKKESKITQ